MSSPFTLFSMDRIAYPLLDNIIKSETHESTTSNTTSNSTSHSTEHHGHEESHQHYVLLALFIIITLGAAIRHIAARFPLPYTVLLVFLGLVIARIFGHDESEQVIPSSFIMLSQMDPHLILFTFLPPLLFESSFALDLNVFANVKWSVLILAGPGLVISTFLTGLITSPVLGHPLVDGLVLGSIISATDPVAVVALLKELGASKRLGHIIEGESMINDGTAIVMFTVMINVALVPHYLETEGGGKIAWAFIRMCFGACLSGLFFGFFTVIWVKRVFNDPYIEISLTLAAPYITFFVTEVALSASGVIAVCVLGMYMNYYRHSISPEVHHFLHQFWGIIGFICNTLIFVLVGMLLYLKNDGSANIENFGSLLFVYIIATIVRLFAIVVCGLPLKFTKEDQFSWKETILFVWGGLRGAVALILGLVTVTKYEEAGRLDVGAEILLFVSGVVLLTLIVNAPTMGRIVKLVGMDGVTESKWVELKSAVLHIDLAAERKISALKKSAWFSNANWEDARKLLPTFTLPPTEKHAQKKDTAVLSRQRFINALRKSYLTSQAEGIIGPRGLHALLHSVHELAFDPSQSLVNEWNYLLKHTLTMPKILERFQTARHAETVNETNQNFIIVRISRAIMHEFLSFHTDVAYGFVVSRNECYELVSEITHDPTIAALLSKECQEGKRNAEQYLKELLAQFPIMIRAVRTTSSARQVLYAQRTAIHELVEEGIIDEGDGPRFIGPVEEGIKKVVHYLPPATATKSESVLHQVDWLSDCKPHVFSAVLNCATKKAAFTKELIEDTHENPSIIVITYGVAEIADSTNTTEEIEVDRKGKGKRQSNISSVSAGSVFGETSIFNTTTSYVPKLVVVSSSLIYYRIPIHQLLEIGKAYPDLIDGLELSAGIKIAREVLCAIEPYKSWPRTKLSLLLEDSVITRHDKSSEQNQSEFSDVAVLVSGSAVKLTNDNTSISEFLAPALLLGRVLAEDEPRIAYQFTKGSRVLHVQTFSNDLKDLDEVALASLAQHNHEGVELSDQHENAPKKRTGEVNEFAAKLCEAVVKGSEETVKKLIEQDHVDPNSRDYDFRTALHIASSEGHASIVNLLIAAHADVNVVDRWGKTPLGEAVLSSQDQICGILRDAGAKLSSQEIKQLESKITIYVKEGDFKTIKRYLSNGISINTKDYDQRSLLHIAAAMGHSKVAEYLITLGADLDSTDKFGHTPLDESISNKHDDITTVLVARGAKQSQADAVTSLISAAHANDVEMLGRLLSAHSDPNICGYDHRTALHVAAGEGHIQVVKFLVEHGASVNVLDRHGMSPIEEAENRHHDEIFEYLRNHGAVVYQKLDLRVSKLIFAASEGNLELTRELVACGVDVNQGDWDRRTALHLACVQNHFEVVKYLLSVGANPNTKDRWGNTPKSEATKDVFDYIQTFLREKNGGVASEIENFSFAGRSSVDDDEGDAVANAKKNRTKKILGRERKTVNVSGKKGDVGGSRLLGS